MASVDVLAINMFSFYHDAKCFPKLFGAIHRTIHGIYLW